MGLKQNQELVRKYPVLQYFVYNHLPAPLQEVSKPFHAVAWKMAKTLPYSPETSVALRKILEGKDAAVRSAVGYDPNSEE